MGGSKTACIFCGGVGVKLTLEHVYPLWLRRSMNIRGDITLSVGNDIIRVTKNLDVKLRDVCEACNHGWLHDLERAFRGAMLGSMHGLGMVMPAAVQLVAALWAVKTWVLTERAFAYTRPNGPKPEIPLPYLRFMREHSEPPPLTQVWVGAVDALSMPPGEQTISFLATQWVGTPPDPPVGLVGVLTIGDLLFHIYNPVKLAGGPDLPPQGLGVGGRLGPFLTQIWPHEIEEVRWPPPSIFAPGDLRRVWPDGGFIRPGTKP